MFLRKNAGLEILYVVNFTQVKNKILAKSKVILIFNQLEINKNMHIEEAAMKRNNYKSKRTFITAVENYIILLLANSTFNLIIKI